MITKFQLLPEPRRVEFLPVEFALPARTLIRLDGDPQLLRFAASRVQDLITPALISTGKPLPAGPYLLPPSA
jgi:hypothetical protein